MPAKSVCSRLPTARSLALWCSTALPVTLLPVIAPMPAKAQALYGATGGQAGQRDDFNGRGGDAG